MTEKKTAEQILKAQYKRQNEHIKEKYDRVSIALPKGTKDRINALKESLNAFIVGATLKALDDREKGVDGPQDQEPQQSKENTQKSPVTWDQLADLEKQKAEKDHAELVNAPHVEPAQHGELAKALFYHGEITQETDRTQATPDAEEIQALIDAKRAEYERNKQAEQTQEDAEKTRVFNPQDYK